MLRQCLSRTPSCHHPMFLCSARWPCSWQLPCLAGSAGAFFIHAVMDDVPALGGQSSRKGFLGGSTSKICSTDMFVREVSSLRGRSLAAARCFLLGAPAGSKDPRFPGSSASARLLRCSWASCSFLIWASSSLILVCCEPSAAETLHCCTWSAIHFTNFEMASFFSSRDGPEALELHSKAHAVPIGSLQIRYPHAVSAALFETDPKLAVHGRCVQTLAG